ncbi:MAG: hypothetical protein DDT42_01923 [candidate division WS2 bacterium]|uniref:Uncharacterized protein n=1 Tax=Psychracetigena formicireducens TaxID=2986056 RepID=A0A9E2BIU4_PSYF1|nr:hypothetical protein [Candidatus Psychracetigena formicireducens]MBT9146044.1 hypothetical protein [Candidatus Psychracetigena formicireducens]MBT9147638.1 hypothetical protein [Bacillota bacterium]
MRYLLILLIISIIAIVVINTINYLLRHEQTENQTEVEQPNWSKVDPLNFLNIPKKHPEKPYTIVNYPPQEPTCFMLNILLQG